MTVTIEAFEPRAEGRRAAIRNALIGYNTDATATGDDRTLAVVRRDNGGRIVGGLYGWTAFSWLFVELLVVPESLRKQGLGTTVLQRAESEAVARGCHSVWLDTFQFQARGFYEKLGYT